MVDFIGCFPYPICFVNDGYFDLGLRGVIIDNIPDLHHKDYGLRIYFLYWNMTCSIQCHLYL